MNPRTFTGILVGTVWAIGWGQVISRTRKRKNILLVCQDAAMLKLADADAFCSIGLDRRQALWEVSNNDRPTALYAGQQNESPLEKQIQLPLMSESENVVHDYAATSLSLKAHPVSFLRQRLDQFGITQTGKLANGKNGDLIKVSGLVLVRQRPGTAKGVCFMTIEDETGVANLVIFQNLFDLYRKAVLQSKLIMVEGKLQIEGAVVHVIVQSVHDFSKLLRQLTASQKGELSLAMSRSDETSLPTHVQQERHKQAIAAMPGSRDFK